MRAIGDEIDGVRALGRATEYGAGREIAGGPGGGEQRPGGTWQSEQIEQAYPARKALLGATAGVAQGGDGAGDVGGDGQR